MLTYVRGQKGPIWFLDLNQIVIPKEGESGLGNPQVRGGAPTTID